ncbi:hypothetical protein SAMN05660284_02205 [Formivibrio citricus]|uniref:DUF2062 domain-containing protein n=1 Tax=Formivibrio citricus TaxID=83765 RepID=A0A1I5BLI6_9NEIS|nr:DUF2062 domain-containing protein [Formivibrio citricus]SFN75664.1 hypothetical protein SAMN05660284_02205 [Formivibrio citricus]
MVKKILRNWLPGREKLNEHAFLRRFAHWFSDPRLWHVNRRSVARSVVAGAIGGLIPGPLQMITAALLALALRGNVLVAMLVTLYSNPLTIGPLYWLAYRLGVFLTGGNGYEHLPRLSSLSEVGLTGWLEGLLEWGKSLGWPLAVGLPALALLLAALGYLLTHQAWRLHVQWELWRRSRRKSG